MKRVKGMDADEYHAVEALSKSGMSELLRSPAHYQAWLRQANEPTAAMQLGTALHCAVLEPDKFSSTYVVNPDDIDFRTKEGKAWKESVIGMEILSTEDAIKVNGMRAAINRVWTVGNADVELSIFTESGVPMKARLDCLQDGVIYDIKTTQDARPDAFMRTVANYKYHLQAAHYMRMAEVSKFCFIAVETEPPHGVGLYWLDDAWIMEGERLRDRAIQVYMDCTVTGEWPGYEIGSKTLSMPAWAIDKTER